MPGTLPAPQMQNDYSMIYWDIYCGLNHVSVGVCGGRVYVAYVTYVAIGSACHVGHSNHTAITARNCTHPEHTLWLLCTCRGPTKVSPPNVSYIIIASCRTTHAHHTPCLKRNAAHILPRSRVARLVEPYDDNALHTIHSSLDVVRCCYCSAYQACLRPSDPHTAMLFCGH